VAEEFVKRQSNDVLVESFAEPKNILLRGSDVALRKRVLQRGQKISPVMAGLLAAAGHCKVPVVRNPFVGIIGTGDEVVEPGKTLANGELYASNGITLASWCAKYRMKTLIKVVKDDHNTILNILKIMSQETDALITSGGAWTGDHDMVAGILEELGWTRLFHRIRIGPGKAVGFGMLDTKPVFILAGSPPSNLMGFLQIALPGLLALSGHTDKGLPITKARLASEIRESEPDWTEFFFGTLEPSEGLPVF
jgi:molybdopterin molybdotransferase